MNSNITDEIRNNVVQKLDNIIGIKVVSRLIEKSIYNYTIHLAKEKNIKIVLSIMLNINFFYF